MLAVAEDARVRPEDGHAAWSESFNELFALAAGCFSNAPLRRHGQAYVLGLLSHTERKNSWWLAEFAGDASPDGIQRLLNFSPWDEDACRDAVCRYAVRHLGDPGAVLAVDEMGVPEERAHVCMRGQAIYRHGRPGGELPGRGLPRVRDTGRGAGAD
jgi:SRSO17 transposase